MAKLEIIGTQINTYDGSFLEVLAKEFRLLWFAKMKEYYKHATT